LRQPLGPEVWTTRPGPIASFLWLGNTANVITLLPVLERLRFGVAHICVVADRGRISAATIAALEAQGIDYILGVRERSSPEVGERRMTAWRCPSSADGTSAFEE
jgi:hypothetical protein